MFSFSKKVAFLTPNATILPILTILLEWQEEAS